MSFTCLFIVSSSGLAARVTVMEGAGSGFGLRSIGIDISMIACHHWYLCQVHVAERTNGRMPE